MPACNPFGDLELSAGGAGVSADGGDRSSQWQLQAKTVLFPRGDGAWSFGALAGAQRDTGTAHGGSAFQNYYGKALASYYPSQAIEIDINLGIANTYGVGTYALAGVALQYEVIDRLQLLVEAFRDEPGTARYQAGIRYLAIPNRFEAYVSYGSRFNGGSTDWWAIFGIRLQTPQFLP